MATLDERLLHEKCISDSVRPVNAVYKYAKCIRLIHYWTSQPTNPVSIFGPGRRIIERLAVVRAALYLCKICMTTESGFVK